jgi:CBS domain containing-hemolysin-like protein
MWIEIILTFVLVALNGFFVAAEFAIVKVRTSQLEIGAENSKVKDVAKHITEHLDAYLAATQLGITIASIGLGIVGEEVMHEILLHLFQATGMTPPENLTAYTVTASFIVITFLHVVFGELAPKSIAIRYPLPTTLFAAMPLRIFYIVGKPFINLFNGFANMILRMIGISPASEHESVHSEEELRIVIAESKASGNINANELELIENVFNFDNRVARQVMHPRAKIFAIDVAWSNDEIIDKVLEEGYSRVPIYENNLDKIIGIVYTKDLIRLMRKQASFNIREIIRPALFVPESKKLKELIKEFQENRTHLAMVIDEFGTTIGMLTTEDLVEEIVGEIYDEYDDEKLHLVTKISDNEFLTNATAPVVDLNRNLPLPLPESAEYNTISGLLMSQLTHIPQLDEKITVGDYEIEVIKTSLHGVEQVKLTLIPH